MRLVRRHPKPQPPASPYDADDSRRWIALGVLLLAAAIDLIGSTIATLALLVIGRDLGAGEATLEWIVAGYGLAFALGLITGGRLGDVVGRRRVFRRWALESAALDLALRQAGRSLASLLARSPRPVTFVNSLRLPDPPTSEPIRERLERFPELRFKLEPTAAWSDELIAEIAATGAVDTLDLKAQYPPDSSAAQPPDPPLYGQLADAFPHAWIEDPAITPDTWTVLKPHRKRIAWDANLRSLADLEQITPRPGAVNVKPVRFGTLRTLLDVYDRCAADGIPMYGGGFDELGPGRHQIQYLASLFHPDAPNDVAPADYNREQLTRTLPTSPLDPTPATTGFRWATAE
ncbi:MAG: MFS transporter [Solirubrobacteraceae bacterium]